MTITDSVMISVADLLGFSDEGERILRLDPPSGISGNPIKMTFEDFRMSRVGRGIDDGYNRINPASALYRTDDRYPTLYEAIKTDDGDEIYRRGYRAGEQFRAKKEELSSRVAINIPIVRCGSLRSKMI